MFENLIEEIKRQNNGCAGLQGLHKCPNCGEYLAYKTAPNAPSHNVEQVDLHCFKSGCVKTFGYESSKEGVK